MSVPKHRATTAPIRLACIMLAGLLLNTRVLGFSPGFANFEIELDGLAVGYQHFAWYLLPGQHLTITADKNIQWLSSKADVAINPDGWTWTAPLKTGLYPLKLKSGQNDMHLNVFVMRPATDVKSGKLGHYKIGNYQKNSFRNLPVYAPPAGFIEIKPEHLNVKVSPHFTVGQFLSKQQSAWPKYLVLRPELLLKLEYVLQILNREGIATDSLHVMSGFRTPWYNQAIGNRTTSSRHLYGGAADIFVDVDPVDGRMDDLNKDGKVDKADALYLYQLLDKASGTPIWRKFPGGLAYYGSSNAHGPFVHIDARGYKARWSR